MRVAVDASVPFFAVLLEVAAAAEAEGLRLRLIGGAAMQLWGRALETPREATFDLDWALRRDELRDSEAARRHAGELVRLFRSLGFARATGAEWRASRSARFQWLREESPIAIEVLCGAVDFGRPSRREPAWELAELEDGPPHFYAARTPWIDRVAEWAQVTVSGAGAEVRVEVPDLGSLALLELKAVRDKLERSGVERDPDRLAHELRRLDRHADDLLQLLEWTREQGRFVEFGQRVRSDAEVAGVAVDADRRLAGAGELPGVRRVDALADELRRLAAMADERAR